MPEHYAGADWVLETFRVEPSPLGAKVADLLGDVWQGIYHLPIGGLKRVEWANDHHITFILHHRNLATWDGCELTALVLLCLDRGLRMDLTAVAPRCLELMFHDRSAECQHGRAQPSTDEVIARIRRVTSREVAP